MRRRAATEVEKRLDLLLDARRPCRDDIGVVELPLGTLLGVADQPGGAADERERAVTGVLQASKGQDLDQVAEVQARRRGVETAVPRNRAGIERLAKRAEVGADGDQAAPLEVVKKVRRPGRWCHARILAHRLHYWSEGFTARRFGTCAR